MHACTANSACAMCDMHVYMYICLPVVVCMHLCTYVYICICIYEYRVIKTREQALAAAEGQRVLKFLQREEPLWRLTEQYVLDYMKQSKYCMQATTEVCHPPPPPAPPAPASSFGMPSCFCFGNTQFCRGRCHMFKQTCIWDL
jgi:hypothetical protein